ncbi:ABC transporter substrate-binding protein [Paenibacillus sp. FSL R7-0331]|uniref:ABC transporter substrate-binding protein n=1 Tax=Paenibacillus sp. FSL R7-0331 TaxID=1536773 RepID=UPI0004F65B08|nr:extracellular solute-binding protein [Paenibacillus sp. FSL R7-0331]AIQ53190.1 ABC transporter substrate-binding protein [Paenibacillus sp. FSL R7-0331]
MYKNSRIQTTAGMLVIAALLVSCGSSRSQDNGGEEVPKLQPVSFSIAYAAGDMATTQALKAVIAAYMQTHPHVTIKDTSEISSNAYLDWLKIKDAVGEFPDLLEMRDTEAFAAAGKIAPLPPELVELLDQPVEVFGQVWNAPLYETPPQGIIYSKKAYAAAGITRLPATYEEFLAVQEKLEASGITPLVAGGKDLFHLGFWINKFWIDDVYADDPDWNARKTAGAASFTDAGVLQAVSDFKMLFTRYVDKGWQNIGDNQTISYLVTGKAAQLYSGPWMFSPIEAADPAFEFGFYAVPDRKGQVNVTGLPSPAGWSFSAEAARDPLKSAAITDFLQYFFEPAQYSRFLSAINGIPATKSKAAYPASEAMNEVLRILSDPQTVKSRMMNNWWGANTLPQQFRNWYYKLLEELVVTDGDVLSVMQEADREYDRQALEEGLGK